MGYLPIRSGTSIGYIIKGTISPFISNNGDKIQLELEGISGSPLSSNFSPVFLSPVTVQSNIMPFITLVSKDIRQIVIDEQAGKSRAEGSFKFKVYSPTNDIYISRENPKDFLQVMFGAASAGNPSAAVLTSDTSSASDTKRQFLVKKGENRSFTLTFVIEPTKGTGSYRVQATSLKLNNGSIKFGSEFVTNYVTLLKEVITPSITVLSPNGGETWVLGQNHIIKWTYPNELVGKTVVLLVALTNSQQTASWPLYNASGVTPGIYLPLTGEVPWSLSSKWDTGEIPSGQYRIVVSALDSSTGITYKGLSKQFNVTSSSLNPPSITILSPNGGENLIVGQPYTAKWNVSGLNSDDYVASISLMYGITRIYNLASNIKAKNGDNSYVITIPTAIINEWPNLISKPYSFLEILLSNKQGMPYPTDKSDSPFTITAPIASITPTVDLHIDGSNGPLSVKSGAYITPSFISSNALYCLNNWDATSRDTMNYGITIGPVTSSKTYTVTCYSSDGSSSADSVTVNVTIAANSLGSLVANALGGVANTPDTKNIASSNRFYFTQYQKEGSFGKEVIELQKLLKERGYYNLNTDGTFGPKTKEALIQLQTASNLKADGIVGREVRGVLNR